MPRENLALVVSNPIGIENGGEDKNKLAAQCLGEEFYDYYISERRINAGLKYFRGKTIGELVSAYHYLKNAALSFGGMKKYKQAGQYVEAAYYLRDKLIPIRAVSFARK